jgi:hypothetical protein
MPRPWLPVFAIACGIAVAGSMPSGLAVEQPVSVTFVEAASAAGSAGNASGNERFLVTALGLRAAEAAPPAAAHVLLLVDTSASQTGSHRQRAMEALDGVLDAARSDDRFAVAAVDVSCKPLSSGFHAAADQRLKQSRLALDARTPLGSTDMVAVLEEAVQQFAGVTGPRAIVYIGDGPGLSGIDAADFSGLIDLLRAEKISVSSLGVGPQINWPCLAAIATATGGMLIVPEADDSGPEAGRRIGGLAVHSVVWPHDVAIASDAADARLRMLPGRLPPLRADRDSVVLIEGDLTGGRLEMAVAPDAAATTVVIPPATPREENAYLAELARNAGPNDGVFLPLLGREGLALARSVIRGEAATLAALSRQAEATGAHAAAVRLAEASLRRDPDNSDASLVRQVAQRQLATDPATLPSPTADELDGDRLTPLDDSRTELDELEAMRRVRSQNLEQETAVKLRDARNLLTSDPDRARERLKEQQEVVRRNDDLDAGTRERLLAQIEMRIRESIVRSREKIECDLAAERRAAIGRERQ